MSTHHTKKFAGVWMDTAKAVIISQEEDGSGSFRIHDTVKGGDTRSGGSEHTINNAKQKDELKYLKAVASLLLPFDEILIFGSGQAQEQLQHHLQNESQFKNKKLTIDSAGQLTDNQAVATVRDFFKQKA